jgi:hypothetical protein
MLPQDVRMRLDEYLARKYNGKLPLGAYQAFFVELINEFLEEKSR